MTQNNDRLDRRRLARSADVGEPEASWADCSVLPRVEILAAIERNRDLGGRALNLFKGGSERKPRLISYARSQTDI
jgi:hypothetical protein